MPFDNSLIIISDTHLHNHPMFGGLKVPEGTPISASGRDRYPGCNQRAVGMLDAIERVAYYAVTNGIEKIIHLGDLFHTKAHVPLAVYNATTRLFGQIEDMGIKVYGIPGNHDYAGKSGKWTSLHTLYSMGPLGTIDYPTPIIINVGKYAIGTLMVPYMASKSQIKQSIEESLPVLTQMLKTRSASHTALFMHTSMEGATVGPHEYVMREGLSMKDIPWPYFNLVMSGHYHNHQTLRSKRGTFWYAGALAQHNLGERTYTPGFIRLDVTDKGIEVNQIENDISPRFHSVDIKDRKTLRSIITEMEGSGVNDFVRVEWRGETYPDDVIIPEWMIVERVSRESTVRPRVAVDPTKDSIETLVKRYVSMNVDPKEQGHIVEAGLELVGQ